jgi:uncharacterized membrane protein
MKIKLLLESFLDVIDGFLDLPIFFMQEPEALLVGILLLMSFVFIGFFCGVKVLSVILITTLFLIGTMFVWFWVGEYRWLVWFENEKNNYTPKKDVPNRVNPLEISNEEYYEIMEKLKYARVRNFIIEEKRIRSDDLK